MKTDTLNYQNVQDGMTNKDFFQALNILIDKTGDTVRWTETDSAGSSFTTDDLDHFRCEVALVNQDVEASITKIEPGTEVRIVGRLDASYPPELRVRVKLAGAAFALFKLAEAYRT